MEAVGFGLGVFGAVGVLGQMFDGCMSAYRVFSTAKNLGKDSEKLVCKVRIEEMRLLVWGREWGVVEGKFEGYLTATAWEGLKDVAKDILSQLLETILDCHKLQEKYGLREEVPGSVDKEAYYSMYRSAAEPARSPSSSSRMGLRKEMKLRARWVVADKEKFDGFLRDLEYYNDRLEKLFPPSKIATLQRTWTNELLHTAERDMVNLHLLETTAAGRYPGLNTMAQLKQLRINLDAREPSKKILSLSEVKIPRWRLQIGPDEKVDARRVRGIYQRPTDTMKGESPSEDVPVLVDWVDFDPEMEMDSRLRLYQRVDNLARMLHSSSNRHPDLHTLDCIGYTEDTANNRYGIIHLSPPPTYHPQPQPDIPQSLPNTSIPPFQTLAQLIEDPTKRTPDLDIRFTLAHTLAIALWSLHSLDWLHKSFCSLNILFFGSPTPNGPEHHDLRSPYVVGFESSRPEGLTEMTADPRMSDGVDLYRHPDSLGVWRASYRKSFDVYSLGLVLLEIGLWKRISVIHKPKYSHSIFREKVIQGLVPALGSKTGSKFRNVVERCLKYDERIEGDKEIEKRITPHQMMESVVLALEGLSV
jgi:hypothetical protein